MEREEQHLQDNKGTHGEGESKQTRPLGRNIPPP